MNINPHVDLLLYGIVLMALGLLAHKLNPELGHAILIVGVMGGALNCLWGVLGLRGLRCRIGPIGTLVIVNVALVVQWIRGWAAIRSGADTLKPTLIIVSVLLVFGIGQLIGFLSRRNGFK